MNNIFKLKNNKNSIIINTLSEFSIKTNFCHYNKFNKINSLKDILNFNFCNKSKNFEFKKKFKENKKSNSSYKTNYSKTDNNKKEDKKNNSLVSIDNSNLHKLKKSNTEKFLDVFNENFPLQLNKEKAIIIDDNLTCFIPLDEVINRVKAVSLTKRFLDHIINPEADFGDICHDKFNKLISLKIYNIKEFRIDDDNIIKYNLFYNKNLKKVKFLVNLYNVKNYICIGFDPSHNVSQNFKNFQHLKDHIIGI